MFLRFSSIYRAESVRRVILRLAKKCLLLYVSRRLLRVTCPFLSHMNAFHTLSNYFFTIHVNYALASTCRSSPCITYNTLSPNRIHVKIPGFLDMRRYKMVHQFEESFTKETCTCGKHRFKTPGNNSARKERKGKEKRGH